MKEKPISLAIAFLVGLAYDFCFQNHSFGLSIPVFVFTVLLALSIQAALRRVRFGLVEIGLALGAALFAALVFLRSSITLTPLNTVVAGYLLFLLVWKLRGFSFLTASVVGYLEPLVAISLGSIEAGGEGVTAINGKFLQSPRRQGAKRVARGVLLALPVLAVFLVLFAAADAVFNDYVGDWVSAIEVENLRRLFIVFAVTFFSLGVLLFTFRPPRNEEAAPSDPDSSLDLTVEATVVLSLVNLLFLGFIAVQFTYLFGGADTRARIGATYAEYARQGFFELLAVTVLAAILIWLLATRIWRARDGYPLLFKGLGVFLIAQVGVVVVSALKRLVLYEDAFGFTTLRFYVHSWFYWLALLLVLLAIKIIIDRSDGLFLAGAFVVTLVGLLALNLANPDLYVARQNIERWERTSQLDVYYLTKLSDDAVPALADAIDPALEGWQKDLAGHLLDRANTIRKRRQRGWQVFRNADRQALTSIADHPQIARFGQDREVLDPYQVLPGD